MSLPTRPEHARTTPRATTPLSAHVLAMAPQQAAKLGCPGGLLAAGGNTRRKHPHWPTARCTTAPLLAHGWLTAGSIAG
eukprot:10586880-Lingulodinium_polyedra.AAC.1